MTDRQVDRQTGGRTGYPSIDKPQLQYYRQFPVRDINVNQTIYDLVFGSNQDNLYLHAIKYLGKEWTYKELKEKTDRASEAFYNAGIREGDVVLVGLSNCPEAIIILLAINKIGGVSKWFDVRAGEKDIEDYIVENNCKIAIVFDSVVSKIQSVDNNTNLERVLVVTPVDSLSIPVRLAYHVKNKNKITAKPNCEYQRYYDFVKGLSGNGNSPKALFDKNRPSVMIQSSGTTGKPKVIVHSDFSATSAVSKLAYSDLPLEKGKILLDLLPPWIAYAIGEAVLYPLALGTEVILCPTFDPDAIMDYLGTFQVVMAAPFHYRYLYEHFDNIPEGKKKQFLDNTECLISGGDKISIEENRGFEEKFKAPLVNGWGNNEGWGCLAVNSTKENCYGSVGIPKYGETLIAYDNESGEELPYNKSGEICALTDTMFLKYANNDGETRAVKKLHKDGQIWLHTGDLGFIDENGHVFLEGRIRRVIIRQGFKISAYTIEDKLTEHPLVKECVAVEVEDSTEEHVPMAFVVLKNPVMDEKAFTKELREKCIKELKEYEVPKYIIIVSELPYTQNGKYDFRLLEQRGKEYVESKKS